MSDLAITDDRAQRLSGLLKEYADKLRAVNERILNGTDLTAAFSADRIAYTLDRFEVIRAPLEKLIVTASQMVEQGELDQFTAEELALRLAEIETELHHCLRLIQAVKAVIESKRENSKEAITRLRVAAGLNAMKGGPLRPKS